MHAFSVVVAGDVSDPVTAKNSAGTFAAEGKTEVKKLVESLCPK